MQTRSDKVRPQNAGPEGYQVHGPISEGGVRRSPTRDHPVPEQIAWGCGASCQDTVAGDLERDGNSQRWEPPAVLVRPQLLAIVPLADEL